MKIEMNLEEFKKYASSVGIKVLNLNEQSVAVEMSIGELLLEEKNLSGQVIHPVEESEISESGSEILNSRTRQNRHVPIEAGYPETSVISITPESVTAVSTPIVNTGFNSMVLRCPVNNRLYSVSFMFETDTVSGPVTLMRSIIDDKKILSIKNVREQLNCSLMEAKRLTEDNWISMTLFAQRLAIDSGHNGMSGIQG